MAFVLTRKGREIISGRMIGATPGQAEGKNVGWGTNPAALTAANTDVAPFTEAPEPRVAGTGTQVTTTTANDTYQIAATIAATGTRAIAEVFMSDSASKPTAVDAVQATSGVIGSAVGTTVLVVSGAAFAVNQYIQIRTEVMQITGIASNTLTVTRGQNGSTAISTIATNDVVTGGNIPGVTTVTNGSLLAHADHGVLNLSNGDSCQYTLKMSFS